MRLDSFNVRQKHARVAWACGFLALVAALALGASVVARGPGRHLPFYFSVFGVVPLFLAIRLVRPSLAAVLGGFWGLCVVSYPSELSRSGAFHATAMCMAIGMPALYAGVCAWASRRIRSISFLLPLAWLGVELSFVPLGFERGFIGTFVEGGPVVGWLTSTLGTLFAGLLIALLANWIAVTISEVHRFAEDCVHSIRASVELLQYSTLCEFIASFSRFAIQSGIPRAPPQPSLG